MILKKFFSNRISEINRRNFIIFFGIFTFIYVMFISIYLTNFYLEFYKNSVFAIPNFYGPMVQKMLDGQYIGARRMPLIPMVLASIVALFGKNFYVLHIVKNLLFYSLSSSALIWLFIKKDLKLYIVLIFAVIYFFTPLLIYLGSMYEAEGYLPHLIVATYCFLIVGTTSSNILASLLIPLLFLTKSSMLYLGIILVILLGIKIYLNSHKILPALVPCILLLMTVVGWGTFTYYNSDHFAYGNHSVESNGLNLYKGNNQFTDKFYPALHVDLFEQNNYVYWDRNLNGEVCAQEEVIWNCNSYYMQKAKNYMLQHPLITLRRFAQRFELTYITVKHWSIEGEMLLFKQASGHGRLSFSLLILRVIFFISLVISVYSIIKRNDYLFESLLLITIAFWSGIPYVIAFVYPRYILPMLIVSLVYVAVYLGNNRKKIGT